MPWQPLMFKLTSVSPLIMHNGRLANPMDPITKQLKAVTDKKKKVDADHIEIARLQFLGSLYMGNGGPIIPSENLEAAVVEGAKKVRRGPDAKGAVSINDHAALSYDGPTIPEELWGIEGFRLTVGVKIGGKRVMATRPVFRTWSATIAVLFDDSRLNAADVAVFLGKAGTEVGIGDWRPRYGRFNTEAAA